MPASPEIIALVERFAHNIDHYHRPEYNETQVRREFLDPFFIALGWDVENRRGVAPRYQDVIHEATVARPDAIFSLQCTGCTSWIAIGRAVMGGSGDSVLDR
jgi:predicted type IV restriction endonuclease